MIYKYVSFIPKILQITVNLIIALLQPDQFLLQE